MKLFDLIRKKFMPPSLAAAYKMKNINGYSLISKNGKLTPRLSWDGMFLFPDKHDPCSCFYEQDYFSEDIKWFKTSEEACEAAWENFDANYSKDMHHKEVG